MNQGLFHHGVNFLNPRIGHRQAANGNVPAMHHDEASRPVQGAVIGIRIADVESQMVVAAGIQAGRLHFVKTLRGLLVPLLFLGPQLSGPRGNGVTLGKHVAFRLIRLHPQFQHGVFLHGTQEYRIPHFGPAEAQEGIQHGRYPFPRGIGTVDGILGTRHFKSHHHGGQQNQSQPGQQHAFLHKSCIMAAFVLTRTKPAALCRK